MEKELKIKDRERGYPCPCCRYLTRSEPNYGTFEICPVCNWEDDYVQFNDPDFKGGANEESLTEARENFRKFSASSKKYIQEVRSPVSDEIP